jgi:hypothetical protein
MLTVFCVATVFVLLERNALSDFDVSAWHYKFSRPDAGKASTAPQHVHFFST